MKTCFIDIYDVLLWDIRNGGPAAAPQPRLDGGRNMTRGGVTPKATMKMTKFLRDLQGLTILLALLACLLCLRDFRCTS